MVRRKRYIGVSRYYLGWECMTCRREERKYEYILVAGVEGNVRGGGSIRMRGGLLRVGRWCVKVEVEFWVFETEDGL
jgi:hypothetical protein